MKSIDYTSPVMPSHQQFSDKLKHLRNQITFYENEVSRHPLAAMIDRETITINGERSFAMYLFMDSWMWPSMLISMRDHVTHAQLKYAIEKNLQDETGQRGLSHIKMCIDFVKSLGFIPALNNLQEMNRTVNVSCKLSEAQIAGWLAGAEILTLPLYKLARKCFVHKPQVDLRYLDVHMEVDEEHIQWLWEAVVSLLGEKDEKAVKEEVSEGIALGARATLKALDEIYEEALGEI